MCTCTIYHGVWRYVLLVYLGGGGREGKVYAASQYTSIQFIKEFLNCISTVLGLLSCMCVGHIISRLYHFLSGKREAGSVVAGGG